MGQFAFKLPDVGEGIAEAELAAWHVKPGDHIEEDQPLADVMTDKATVEMSSPVAGVVRAVRGFVGDKIPVGSVLVEIETGDTGPEADAPAPRASAAPAAPKAPEPFSARRPREDGPLAAPATRRRAHELGIVLEDVPGTGPAGRITPRDLETYAAGRGKAPASREPRPAPRGGVRERKIIGLRRRIAERMELSARHIPHFSYVEEFDMTALEALRKDLNEDRTEGQSKLTLLPFFMRALVKLVPAFPQVNAHYDEDSGVLREYAAVHIGIATQTKDGLMVPVVRHAETRDLWECARELQRVTAAAREGKATRDELMGSTITLTSLGALGGIAATPIINAPEVAIIGPNKLVDRTVVLNGQITVRTMMNLSASFDHRIVDGHDAARFVQALKHLIEQPARLFM